MKLINSLYKSIGVAFLGFYIVLKMIIEVSYRSKHLCESKYSCGSKHLCSIKMLQVVPIAKTSILGYSHDRSKKGLGSAFSFEKIFLILSHIFQTVNSLT